MSARIRNIPRCFDPESMIPISRNSTAEAFKTGAWSNRRPVFREKTSPCRAACPNGNNIPTALALAAQGDFDGALAEFLKESPLPGVCGRVCYHPCQETCNRAALDGAVTIRSLERAISDLGSAEPGHLTDAGRNKNVAVVGSGPAGLAAAYHLARMGHPVTLIEATNEPGGLLARGIPEFRLPRPVLQRDLDRILSLPITLKTGLSASKFTLNGLCADHEAVVLALGANRQQSLGLEGQTLGGILFGLDFLRRPDLQAKCRGAGVVVIGGGNTAVDAARTALRRGAKEVTVLYRRTRPLMPAFPDETAEAEDEGVVFQFMGGPVRFIGSDDRVTAVKWSEMKPAAPGPDGRARTERIAGSEKELSCDLVITATGQGLDAVALPSNLRRSEGRIWVDASGRTSRPGLYAGGDMTPARASVVDAIASGKRAALAVHCSLTESGDNDLPRGIRLGNGPAFSIEAYFHPPRDWSPGEVVHLDELDLLTAPPRPPAVEPTRNAEERRSTFDQVVLSLDGEIAGSEAGRCFFCGVCVGCDRCFIYCPEASMIRPEKKAGAYRGDPDYCKGCGACAAECIRGVLGMSEGS